MIVVALTEKQACLRAASECMEIKKMTFGYIKQGSWGNGGKGAVLLIKTGRQEEEEQLLYSTISPHIPANKLAPTPTQEEKEMAIMLRCFLNSLLSPSDPLTLVVGRR